MEARKSSENEVEELRQLLQAEQNRCRYLTGYFHKLLEAMTTSIVIVDEDLCVTHCNHAAEWLFGESRAKLEGAPLSVLLPVKELQNSDSLEAERKLDGKQEELILTRKSDGARIPVLFSASSISYENGDLEGMICVLQNLSERKNLEARLLQAQKLESVGQLAAGVAHEINTPIQYIRDNMVFLRQEFAGMADLLRQYSTLMSAPAEVADNMRTRIVELSEQLDLNYLIQEIPLAVTQSLEGAEVVAKIVDSMKAFSHPGSENKSHMDINAAIESTITVSRNEWKYVAEVEARLQQPSPSFFCYGSEITQALLNVIVNAAHAIGDRVHRGEIAKGLIKIATEYDNTKLVIKVSDNGGGIPDQIKDKIFDPFFTTKEVGKGTGQGLTIVHNSIVTRHKGSITVETKVGEGATFIIELPVLSE